MDDLEEIPNEILIVDGENKKTVVIPQMQRTLNDFKARLSQYDLKWNDVTFMYQDEQDVLQAINFNEDYIKAISCINAQVFFLKAIYKKPTVKEPPPVVTEKAELMPMWVCSECCRKNPGEENVCSLCGEER